MFDKINYKANYDYFINKYITEYDIAKANINILRSKNVIDDKRYNELNEVTKEAREIIIGNEIRYNRKIYDIIFKGIIEARYKFMEINNIRPEEVLYMNNDSITLINKPIIYTDIDERIRFRKTKEYTSYYKLDKIDLLYFNDKTNEDFRLKFVDQNRMVEMHKGYFLDFLLCVAEYAQNCSPEYMIKFIKDIYIKYINKQLDINFYREFNANSSFKLKYNNDVYALNTVNNINDIDIDYNAILIRTLYKIFMKEYFSK